MKQANNGLTPRPDIQNAPIHAPIHAPANTTPRFDTALPDLNLSAGADVFDGTGHARGGHGIFGEPKVC